MADQNKPKADDEEVIEDEVVETPKGEDENLDDDSTESEEGAADDESDESEESDDESKDKDETGDEDEVKFEKRFTQIKGETLEEYNKNLEEAYRNSSTEGQKNGQLVKTVTAERDTLKSNLAKVNAAIANDPELAQKLNDALGGIKDEDVVETKKPAEAWAEDQMKKQFDTEYAEFTDLHSEMITDDDLRQKVLDELGDLAQFESSRGKTLGMAEGLRRAWNNLGLDKEDSKEETITKAKEQAAKPNTPGKTKKSNSKPEFTEDQIAYAKRFGITPEQLAENSK